MAFLLCPSTGTQLVALLFSVLEDLLFLFSFLGSHPLQLAYILFFSSYIIRVFSFLSPLLLTTSLVLLAFLTISPFFAEAEPPPDVSPAFFKNTCVVVLDALKARLEAGQSSDPAAFGPLNSILPELEACMNVAVEDYCEDKVPIEEDGHRTSPKEEEVEDYYEDKAPIEEDSNQKSGSKEEKEKDEEDAVLKEAFTNNRLIGWEEFEAIGKLYKALTNEVGEYPIKLAIRNLKKKQLFASSETMAKEGSLLERSASVLSLDGWETPVSELEEVESPTTVIKSAEFAEEREADGFQKASGYEELATESLQRYGSVRSAKEWKRTLAGKLYEERWTSSGSVGDEDGMDLLWQEEEEDGGAGGGRGKGNGKAEKSSVGVREKKNDGKGEKKKSKSSKREEKEEEAEEEEEDEVVGRFCCLHALKFSTGRMNLGLGKVSKLVKASKALKSGAALFQHSGRRSRRERVESG